MDDLVIIGNFPCSQLCQLLFFYMQNEIDSRGRVQRTIRCDLFTAGMSFDEDLFTRDFFKSHLVFQELRIESFGSLKNHGFFDEIQLQLKLVKEEKSDSWRANEDLRRNSFTLKTTK
jgi:adenine-specific DNA methylase